MHQRSEVKYMLYVSAQTAFSTNFLRCEGNGGDGVKSLSRGGSLPRDGASARLSLVEIHSIVNVMS